jgi:hypothetical protein
VQDAVLGVEPHDRFVGNGEPHVAAAEDQLVGLEERLAFSLRPADRDDAFRLGAHQRPEIQKVVFTAST